MWGDPHNSSQMLINPSGWGTESPDPKFLKETGFREWLNKNSQPKLPVSGKNKAERFWRAVQQPVSPRCQGFWSLHLLLTLTASLHLLGCHEGGIWGAWSQAPIKHTGGRGRAGSLPAGLGTAQGHREVTLARSIQPPLSPGRSKPQLAKDKAALTSP